MSGCCVVFVLVGSALVESLVGSGIGGEETKVGAGRRGRVDDCLLQRIR